MDWSELPQELLGIIGGKLVKIYIDYVRFRAVCVKWRSSVSSAPHHLLPTQLPWLLFSYISDNGTDRRFLDLSTNKLHPLNLMESRESRCCGSSQGWLVFVEEFIPTILLINPLTRNVIYLPPLTTIPNVLDFDISNLGNEYLIHPSPNVCRFDKYSRTYMRDYFIKKVVLSSSPNSSDYIALIIFYQNAGLAFYKKGVEEWFLIYEAGDFYEDAIYYNGSFYVINEAGSISICDLSGVSPIVTQITGIESPILGGMVYLVDSFGELMLVNRYMELRRDSQLDSVNEKVHFSVFKYYDDFSKPEWVQMDTLGDHMLFVGGNSSVCLSASDFLGCERNCIYFSSDAKYLENGHYDFGVYHLDDNSIVPLPDGGDSSWFYFLPPIWVTPNLY